MKLPAILCVAAQWRAALAADRVPAPSCWYARHLARCPRCQQDRAEVARLEHRLRTSAPAVRVALPPQGLPRLEARLRWEQLAGSRPAPRSPNWLRPAWALGCVGLLGVAAWLLRPSLSPEAEPRPVVFPAPALPVLSAALETDPVTTLATRLHDPLQTELGRMLKDLRKVGHSLAVSFLPESLPATPPQER